ncbi:MAG: FtsI, partial [Acidobacteria bacterium]|nr:FtsI [Acidobacteriota bacterium]
MTVNPEPARPRHRLRRILMPLAVALIVLAVLLAYVSWLPLRQARDAWRAGRNVEAIEKAQSWSRLHLWPHQYEQLLAVACLSVGDTRGAAPHLRALTGTKLWLTVLPKEEVARRFFGRGRYAAFLDYDAASRELRESKEVPLYRAAAQAALNRIADAEVALRAVDRSAVDGRKLAALEAALAQRKQGSYPLVVDRDGRTIAAYQLANGDLVSVDVNFAALVEKEAGALTIESHLPQLGVNDTIETTLDPFVQKAAMDALGGFRGSLVAIDPRTNEILALASNRGNGPLANLAIEHQYEPGSVIKVLTGLNAVNSGVDLKAMFPYHCTGDLLIDGRHFGDWIATGHGVLPTLDDALAESCNIAFADLGLRLGKDKLHSFMTAAGFDGQADLGLFRAPLGRTIPPIVNRFETAFYAIGLEHESVNALHLAMISSMVANRGVLTTPRLLRDRRSILGEVVAEGPER